MFITSIETHFLLLAPISVDKEEAIFEGVNENAEDSAGMLH